MSNKKTNAELRLEVEEEDSRKDVPITAGIIIATLSGITAGAAVLACLAVGFLEHFRADVRAYWMACVPFVFPAATAVTIAYRKQLSNVGLHISLLLISLLAGCAGYAYSIDIVYLKRYECVAVDPLHIGSCDKDVLVFIYLISGAVACGFGGLSLLVSMCTCNIATKRRNIRFRDDELRKQREADRVAKEIKHLDKRQGGFVPSKPTNGQSKPVTNGNSSNNTLPQQDATTHL